MIIDINKVVAVNYSLSVNDFPEGEKELVEETREGEPFVFLFGNGGLLEEFESNLKGLKSGDRFEFSIAYQNGYGPRHDDHIVNIPKGAFLDPDGNFDDEMVAVGNMLPMTDSEGNRLQGMVEGITDEFVRMDFNHPLAGKNLFFAGTVLDVRQATDEEVAHGHVHGPGGHHH
jgi:FKBP-type peptidyl-prolyl cis-trans isomerase SlyD